MDHKLVIHVFASLQSLERYVSNIRKMLNKNLPASGKIEKELPAQEKVVTEMRKLANKLQLEVAKGQELIAVRTLNLFYGMNQLVRQDLIHAYAALCQPIPQTLVHSEQPNPNKDRLYH